MSPGSAQVFPVAGSAHAREARFVVETREVADKPLLFLGMDQDCQLRDVRRILYQQELPVILERLDASLETIEV